MNGRNFSSATALLRLTILTAATAVATTTRAEAEFSFWSGSPDGSYFQRQPTPHRQVHRQKSHKHASKEAHQKEIGPKPQGPLVIAISIDRQKVTIYDSKGRFAESPVSTGMRGHSTPMGVFSVIEKERFHRSNIYSGAPMPYMQRITWSGVAMHAGVLPGYPASHGCIRMPAAFAEKMYHWTKVGARVIVAPGEMTPSSFSHPLLASHKALPQPVASVQPPADAQPSVKPDKETLEGKSANPEPAANPKPTGGQEAAHDTTTDSPPAHDEAAASAEGSASVNSVAEESPKLESATRTVVASEPAKSSSDETTPGQTKADDADAKPVDAKPVESATAPTNSETKPVEAKRSDETPDAAVMATTNAPPEAPDAKGNQTSPPAPAPTMNPEAAKSEASKSETSKSEAIKPAPPKRAGQIAVFISRRDAKIYVRQNFTPLFDAPVMITPSDRPLGTHVFTAEADQDDANALRWSVVSLPASRSAERGDDRRISRHRRHAAPVIQVAEKPTITPDSPSEALDRIVVPEDAMTKINELLTTGASIVVSDQGINQGETGKGTDFIVRLR